MTDVGCVCDSPSTTQEFVYVDNSSQYENYEKDVMVFEAVLEDVNKIPPILYDKEGNIYLIEVASSKTLQNNLETEELEQSTSSEIAGGKFLRNLVCEDSSSG